MKTDIDPLQPKVTVLGNENPNVLIKKLLKVGKHAELSSYEELQEEKKDAVTKEKEKHNNGRDIAIEKTKDITEVEDGGKDKVSSKGKRDPNMTTNASNPPQKMKEENPPLLHPEVDVTVHPSMHQYINMKTHPQHCCYIAQPCAVAVPYYATPSCPDIPFNPACDEEFCHFDRPRFQPPFLRPVVRAGDYFSDENTMGCHVM